MSQMSFQYRAVNSRGQPTRGTLRALSRDDAYRRIAASGLRPVRIKRAAAAGGLFGRNRRVSVKDLAHLTFQLSVLIDARVPIADGLRSIAEQESNDRLREVIIEMASQIEAGQSITASIAPHRALFGDVYVETLRAAEHSGNLSAVLAHLAEMLDQQYEMRKNIKSALLYPMCVIAALSLAVTFLIVFAIPKFAEIFSSRGAELPLLTRSLLLIGETAQSYWYIILPVFVAFLIISHRLLRHDTFRKWMDGQLHRVPKLRTMLVAVAVSRFCHVFGLSLKSGLGLIDAIDLAGASSGRPLLIADAERLRSQVNQGGRLSDVLRACSYFPGFARRMLIAGEEAGEISRMCRIVARHYDREVTHLAKNVATVIEPVLIVALAAVVLVVALAIFLPMWNMAVVIG